MARGDQLGRQWKILQMLISARRGKSVSDLAQEIDCHTRTVYRDLEALQVAGFPVYTEKEGGKNLWLLLDSAKHQAPIPLSLTELMALYFSRGMMKVLKNTVFYDSLESLFEKIKATLPSEYMLYLNQIEQSVAIGSKPYKHYNQFRDLIEKISTAIVQKKNIEMIYYTMSRSKETRRKLAPYKIWFFDDTFYLIGNCGMRDDVRIFALDRIKDLELTGDSFEMPADFDLEDFMKLSFGVFRGEPIRVRIWFAADIAGYISEKIWHESQSIETQSDGSIIFEAEVAGTMEIKYWIMKWGARAKVLEPDSLKREIRDEAENIVANYK
jgi:predicted DNA-binding transcriptional regulator YafY